MELAYFYCCHCGLEDVEIKVDYSRKCASGDICYCPECEEEVIINSDWEYEE